MATITDTDQELSTHIDPVEQLNRDLRKAATSLGPNEARFLVDRFYQVQHFRIRTAAQIRSEQETQEPNLILQWQLSELEKLENNIKTVLGDYAKSHRPGRWALSVTGIGPVIAACLLAHIDIEKAETAGAIWRFAGLDPTVKWLGKAGAKTTMEAILGELGADADPDEIITETELEAILSHADGAYVLSDQEVAYLANHLGQPTGLLYVTAADPRGHVTLEAVRTKFGPVAGLAVRPAAKSGTLSHAQVIAVAHATNRAPASLYRLATNEEGYVTKESLTKALAKRPWNATLKVVAAFKFGESAVKVQNRESDIYGHIFAERKVEELRRNNMRAVPGSEPTRYVPIVDGQPGQFAEQAAHILETRKIDKATEAFGWYVKGLLPPANIHARARRYAAKLMLAHYHHVAFESRYGKEPPKPYILTQPGHTHYLAPPGWPCD